MNKYQKIDIRHAVMDGAVYMRREDVIAYLRQTAALWRTINGNRTLLQAGADSLETVAGHLDAEIPKEYL